MRLASTFLALAGLMAAGSVQAQIWPQSPDDPAWQAGRLRLERERWRTGLELRALQAEADDARTRAVISDIQSRRSPVMRPPPPGTVYLGPIDPALVDPDSGAATRARDTMEQGLSGLSDYLDRTRPD